MAWGGQKGIAIMWPFLGPLVVDPNDPGTAYQTNPFTNPSSFTSHITPTVLAQIKAAGFDHVRLSVAPGPWIDAVGDVMLLAPHRISPADEGAGATMEQLNTVYRTIAASGGYSLVDASVAAGGPYAVQNARGHG